MNNSDMPAMPNTMLMDHKMQGLTKREHFAGLAMQALLAHYGNEDADECASYAVEYAQALLKALETSHE
jgi:hypothetical protein